MITYVNAPALLLEKYKYYSTTTRAEGLVWR